MKILFLYANDKSPSFLFYKKSLSKIKDLNIIYSNKKKFNNLFDFDFIFILSGYDYFSLLKQLKFTKNILFEPRYLHKNFYNIFSGIIHNGLESELNLIRYKIKSLIYPPFPEYNLVKKNYKNKNLIRILYHGNKIHLKSLKNKINFFIDNYEGKKIIYIDLVYNYKNLGKVKFKNINKKNIILNHHNFSYGKMTSLLGKADIGLVPQLIPLQRKIITNLISSTLFRSNNENLSDLILRFKHNSNLGRHLVFSKWKIPILTDPTLSSLNFINHGESGYLFYDNQTFNYYLNDLIENESKRVEFGLAIKKKYEMKFSHKVLNKKLLNFLREI